MTGVWLQTANRRKWSLLNPSPDMVDWSEVAHALSHLCRFTGHTRTFYSVAEHSCKVWEMATLMSDDPRVHLHALLHDGHEFVLGDITTPLQTALRAMSPGFRQHWSDLKARTDRAIFAAAGLTDADLAASANLVHHADMAVLMREREVFLGAPPEPWDAHLEAIPPAPVTPRGWTPEQARSEFLRRLRPLLAEVAGGAQEAAE